MRISIIISLLLFATNTRAGDLTPEELTDDHLQSAITALGDALHAQRKAETHWDPRSWDSSRDGSETQKGGYTALATLALLYAGESYQSPRLRDAVDWLATNDLEGTYAMSVRTSLWARLPDRFRTNLDADADWLKKSFSPAARGWDYDFDPDTIAKDNSIRQFGALALWDAARRGVSVDDRMWAQLEDAFVDSQLPDGGWNYREDGQSARGSMTCAGLATLFITQDLLHARDSVKLRRRGEPKPYEAAIARGLEWMDREFLADDNPGSYRYFFYYAWGVERVGLASGRRDFGGVDWYRACGAEVLNRLGEWDRETGAYTVYDKLRGRSNGRSISPSDLSFALLFLSRGRFPVGLNKFDLGPDVAWNNRPRDVANLAAHLSSTTENEINWQLVRATDAPESWLDAPLLILASHEAIAEDPARDAAIRRYLDLGGLLFATNDGSARAFPRSIEELGTRLYPGLEWRTLPEDHHAYTIYRDANGRRAKLRGLSNGVRELIVLAPRGDYGAIYQGGAGRNDTPLAVAENLFLYASEKGRLRPRLAPHVESFDAAPAGGTPLVLAHARYEGSWNPEPLALTRFAAWATETTGRPVEVIEAPLAGVHELDPPADLVYVTGTAAHAPTPAEAAAIASVVEAGTGVVLFESAGGNGELSVSAETFAEKQFDRPLRSAATTAIVTAADLPGATALPRVAYRETALDRFGARETAPRLQVMTFDGTPRVIFSREDLTHALLDQPCWGIAGYETDSARQLLLNMVLLGAQ